MGHIDKCLHAVFQHAIDIGDVPEYWREGTAVMLYKKGVTSLPDNYRGISLLNVMGKIFTSIMQRKIGEFHQLKKKKL